jgi:hypothetical protein
MRYRQYFGWDLLGTADAYFKALIPDWIPVIQGVVLLAGLRLGLSRGSMALKDLLPYSGSQLRAMLLPAAFALLAVNLLLKRIWVNSNSKQGPVLNQPHSESNRQHEQHKPHNGLDDSHGNLFQQSRTDECPQKRRQ